MSGRQSAATAITVLVVACLFIAPIASVVAVGGVDGGSGVTSNGGADSAADDVAVGGTAADAESESNDSDTVGPELRSVNGTVQLVVRFEGDTQLTTGNVGTSGATVDGSESGDVVSTNDLRSNAANAQADFETFAGTNPAVTVDRSFWLANAMLVTVDTEQIPIDRLLKVRGVERVHENFEVELDSAATAGNNAGVTGSVVGPSGAVGSTTPTSVATASTEATYGVEMVRAPEVWQEFETRGEGATIAVIDTGIDPDHPDLTVSGWAEFNSTGALISEGPENAYDDDGHGTHVAGSVAGGNASGTAIGVAPDANLYGIKTFDEPGAGATFAQVAAGMERATDESDVDVLQMSLGASGTFSEFIEPVQNAREAGKVVIASSGNGGQGTSSSPANIYDSLAVGAVDENRNVSSISSGETINTEDAWDSNAPEDWPDEYVVPDVSGPGVDVFSAEPGGTYDKKTGTSMAAPHVSGVAALMLSASTRDVSDQELYDTLRDTANHPQDATEPDTEYGTGIVDAFAAVSSVTENRSNLTVTDFDAPNETVPGATLETSATINNTGEDPGTGTVEYRFNDTVGDESNVSLQPGEETTVAFSYVVPSNTTTNQTYDHGAYTDNSNLTAGIDVVDTSFYQVTNLTAPGIVERDGTLNATANVTNQGVVDGENRSVELRLTDPGNESTVSTLAATTVSLGAGNGTTVSLNGTVPSEFDTGETTVTAASPEDSDSASIRIADAVGTINGTVIDAETNATLPDIDVLVETGAEVVGETTTESDGVYAIDVPATNLTVTASNATYAPSSQNVTLNESTDTATANFSLALRNGTLSGVVGSDDGLGGPTNATVTVTNATGNAVAAVDTDEDGTYGVDLRPDTYDVTVDAPDFESETVTDVDIEPNSTTDRSFELVPLPATLSGTVADAADGTPIGGATVTIKSKSMTTGSDGAYSFAVDRGERTVTASADGYTDSSRTINLAANETRQVNLSLDVISSGDDDGDDDGGSSGGTGGGGAGGGGGGSTAPPGDDADDAEDEEEGGEEDDADGEDADDEEGTADEDGEDADDPTDGPADDTSDERDVPSDDGDGATNGSPSNDAVGSEDVSDDDAPGFGALAAVASLVAVAMLARRVHRGNGR